jgi:RimJ/RimL family protein N-acetyltransferase
VEIIEPTTERLQLRQWKNNDLTTFSNMNADSDVMEFYPKILNKNESDAFAYKIQTIIKEKGWGFWAVELINEKKFIGFVGLHEPEPELPCSPCVEIGWRLAKQYWGNGYATEAAKASLKVAFETLNFDEVYSFTSVLNVKSQALMKRLNMSNTNNNFNHPSIPEDNPLREHILFKISQQHWKSTLDLS